MSGHSHWATIRRKKEGNDAKRGSLFTKLAREIVIAAREGGGDPDSNIGLRVAIDKARSMGMPKDNIDRAVRRGAGTDKDGETFDEIMYEGYGPSGVAVLIDVLTDNRNRTVAALRHALSRQGGSLAEAGAVAWQFERKGTILVPAAVGFDRLFEAAVEAGAEDVIEGEEELEVRTAPTDLKIVYDALRGLGIEISSMDLVMTPKNSMALEARDAAQVLKLVDFLEEMDDVRRVFTNLDVTEEAVAAFEAMA
jgi:YebC/PmpR family DNA-binding regulatory protein